MALAVSWFLAMIQNFFLKKRLKYLPAQLSCQEISTGETSFSLKNSVKLFVFSRLLLIKNVLQKMLIFTGEV